jgi:hypothetical protein
VGTRISSSRVQNPGGEDLGVDSFSKGSSLVEEVKMKGCQGMKDIVSFAASLKKLSPQIAAHCGSHHSSEIS